MSFQRQSKRMKQKGNLVQQKQTLIQYEQYLAEQKRTMMETTALDKGKEIANNVIRQIVLPAATTTLVTEFNFTAEQLEKFGEIFNKSMNEIVDAQNTEAEKSFHPHNCGHDCTCREDSIDNTEEASEGHNT